MFINKRKGYRIVFLISFLFSIYTSSILFIYFQSKIINKFLLEDFRIVAAISNKKIEETVSKISQIKGIKAVNFVSSQELLKRLEEEDRELYLAVKSFSTNPVPDVAEIEVDDMYFGAVDNIVDNLSRIDGITDIRYRPDELVAIMHSEFYIRFLMFVLTMSFFVIFLMIIFSLIHAGLNGFIFSVAESFKWFLNGILGGVSGIFFIYVIVLPLKKITPFWKWFEWYYIVIVVISCGFIGWVFYQWKKD